MKKRQDLGLSGSILESRGRHDGDEHHKQMLRFLSTLLVQSHTIY